jgi:hypothetical protein
LYFGAAAVTNSPSSSQHSVRGEGSVVESCAGANGCVHIASQGDQLRKAHVEFRICRRRDSRAEGFTRLMISGWIELVEEIDVKCRELIFDEVEILSPACDRRGGLSRDDD